MPGTSRWVPLGAPEQWHVPRNPDGSPMTLDQQAGLSHAAAQFQERYTVPIPERAPFVPVVVEGGPTLAFPPSLLDLKDFPR